MRTWPDIEAAADELLERSQTLLDKGRAELGGRWAPFSIQRGSCNRKLAPQRAEPAPGNRTRFVPIGPFVASTYASIRGTCPDTCTFKDAGCYAQAGANHLTMGRLDRSARGLSDVTQLEAAGLAKAWARGVPQDGHRGGRDLRLHVGGDANGTDGARALGRAVEVLKGRGLGTAWTYTHRWRHIPRRVWGPISVLASVETTAQAHAAIARGYPPALTVSEFPSPRAWSIGGGWKIIPCPYRQGGKVTCATCRLCLDRDLLGLKRGIGFAVHGMGAEAARKRLRVLQ